MKESELASLFGKLKYEENLIDSIYDTEKKKSLATATPLSTTFFSTFIVQDFQDSPDDEEYTRRSQEYLNDLEEEFQERTLLAKSKRFFKKGSQRFSGAKATDETQCHKCGRKCYFAIDCFSKTSVPSFSSPFQNSQTNSGVSSSKSSMVKNKGLVAKAYEWDEEDMSSDDNEMTEVKVLMALADNENGVVGKESARNSKCVSVNKSTLKRKVLGLDQITEDLSGSGQKDLDLSCLIMTLLMNLQFVAGDEPVSGPKTIKLILKLNSTFKAETLKGVTINKPSSAPTKGRKNVLASKNNSAPTCKLKNVKIEDDLSLSIVMKELNDL
ncbi:hypothetical protein Tco_1390113 [Tanacetum coccineum]